MAEHWEVPEAEVSTITIEPGENMYFDNSRTFRLMANTFTLKGKSKLQVTVKLYVTNILPLSSFGGDYFSLKLAVTIVYLV